MQVIVLKFTSISIKYYKLITMSREGKLNEAPEIRTLSDQFKKYKQYFAISIDFQILENLRLFEIYFQNISNLNGSRQF